MRTPKLSTYSCLRPSTATRGASIATGKWSAYRPFATVGPYTDVCYLWTPTSANATTGTVTTVAGLGGAFCVANDINSSGYIVGASTTSAGAQHAFLWAPTSDNASTGNIQLGPAFDD